MSTASFLWPTVYVCAFVVVAGRYRRFRVVSSCRQAARRGTVYLLTRWTISWCEQTDVRTSHGAGHRMWGWRSTDNDSATERCSRSTLALLRGWLCIINQLQWQQFVVEVRIENENSRFPFSRKYPVEISTGVEGGNENKNAFQVPTDLYGLHRAVVVWSTGQANEME